MAFIMGDISWTVWELVAHYISYSMFLTTLYGIIDAHSNQIVSKVKYFAGISSKVLSPAKTLPTQNYILT